MAKTNPIGVRFRQDVLDKLKIDHAVESPQKALVFLEMFYVTHHALAKDITQVLRKDAIKEILPERDASETKKRIEAIRAEKIPEHRNTPLGRRSWKIEQDKRIATIQSAKDG